MIVAALLQLALVGSLAQQEWHEFSANRVGPILACDPLGRVDSLHPQARDTSLLGEDGELTWPGKFVPLAEGEWILFESSWAATDEVSRWSTNSPSYKTPRGYSIGTTIEELRRRGERVSVAFPEGALIFEIVAEDVAFTVDSESTRQFLETPNYWERGSELLPPDARITYLSAAAPCWER
jgi:hypothetical protein